MSRFPYGGKPVETKEATTGPQFRLLGPLEADRDGRRVELGGAKPRALLAALLAEQGRPVSNDRLIDALWGDAPPSTATKIIQKYISQLRKELGPTIVTHANGYALKVPDDDVDVTRFELLVSRAGTADRPEETVEMLEEALSLWRGEPYQELGDTQVGMAERARLEELRLSALEDLCQSELDLGRHGVVVARVESLVRSHPFREQLWAQLMVALYRSGRQSDALRAYQRLRRILAEELGLDPSSELQRLEERILLHDPELGPSAPRPSPPSNLRPSITSFVGRIRELAEIEQLLDANRLVNLIGPPGSGKTRLAFEAARGQLDRFRDGVWFVDLAPLTSPDQVVNTVAAPLGVSGQGKRPTQDVLVDYLAERRLQLILDNCEHVLAKAGSLITLLLSCNEHLTVLATSRQPLGVAGEVTYEVPPLPFPEQGNVDRISEFDAVRLFVDRARAADPHFELSDANAAAVAEICRRLDGMPLALELAAARARSLPPSQLARHLDDRLILLASPSPSPLSRHQTLEAAVDWSYDLLRPPERALFRRLSVFRGGFDLEAAEQVCGADLFEVGQTLPMLTELAERSMIRVEGRGEDRARYRLLETLREYGQGRLDSKESQLVRNAHARHFRDVADRAAPQFRGPGQQAWLERVSSDIDNLRKALRWTSSQHPETAVGIAIALADYWDSVGSRTEGHEWTRRAVELSKTLTPQLRIGARLAAADLFISTHLSSSMRYAEEALETALEVADETAQAKALRVLSWAHGIQGNFDDAAKLGSKALTIFEKAGDIWETALCLERLGEPFQDPESSIRHLRKSLDLFRQVGDRKRQSVVLYKLASRTAQALRDFPAAIRWIEESLAICEELGNSQDQAHASLEYGGILRRQGETERAREVLEEALEQLRRIGDQRCSIRALTAIAVADLEAGHSGRAVNALRQSLELSRTLDERPSSRVALAVTARLLAAQGRNREAASLYGFVDALAHELAVRAAPAASEKRSKLVESLRLDMSEDEFESAWQTGQAMDLDDAIALAIAAGDPG